MVRWCDGAMVRWVLFQTWKDNILNTNIKYALDKFKENANTYFTRRIHIWELYWYLVYNYGTSSSGSVCIHNSQFTRQLIIFTILIRHNAHYSFLIITHYFSYIFIECTIVRYMQKRIDVCHSSFVMRFIHETEWLGEEQWQNHGNITSIVQRFHATCLLQHSYK